MDDTLSHEAADISVRGDYDWNGIHRDCGNSDFAPKDVEEKLEFSWSALDGAAILFGPAIGPGRRRYVTTGQSGLSSHLHCFAPDGQLLHSLDPSKDQPSSRVCTDVPLFDAEGRLFVSDDRYVWCFDDSLNLIWRTDFIELGASSGFVSTILTKAGHVGGVTMDGQVILLQRGDGQLARPIACLPVGRPFPAPQPMPGLWHGNMMDPALIALIEPGFFGFGFAVTCSPAVNAKSGLIYVPVVSQVTGKSELFALDETPDHIKICWASPIAGSCTSSPSISPDGQRIYTVNGAGLLHAFDATNGNLLWTKAGAGTAASPAIGDDDTVYSAGRDPSTGESRLLAIRGGNGSLLWSKNFDNLARDRLEERPASQLFPNPRPSAVANSVPTVTPNYVMMVVNLGYDFIAPHGKTRMHQPHVPTLLKISRDTGAVISSIPLMDTSEAVVVIGSDGFLHVCHAALLSSVFHFGINHQLPIELRSPLIPRGGFTTLSHSKP
ncbi:PQQ-binding-like beta-propeller repeat protein [Parasphingorhabdus sp.]|uniref:outer membrane protein assembly factor BamB family protein n=1 Tax=Parasphingorhabdus sp. TaxID=2709688 RepID=UPI0032EECFC6